MGREYTIVEETHRPRKLTARDAKFEIATGENKPE